MTRMKKLWALLLALLMLGALLPGCTAAQLGRAGQAAEEIVGLLEEISEETPSPVRVEGPEMKPTEAPAPAEEAAPADEAAPAAISEDGVYTTKEDLALYIHTYGHLPPNFITKSEAQEAGWSGGSLEPYCPGMCIGGDRFGNREGLLPSAKGRTWTECDVNTLGARSRGAERIVFSNDGLIYYTGDHYESFQQLY